MLWDSRCGVLDFITTVNTYDNTKLLLLGSSVKEKQLWNFTMANTTSNADCVLVNHKMDLCQTQNSLKGLKSANN